MNEEIRARRLKQRKRQIRAQFIAAGSLVVIAGVLLVVLAWIIAGKLAENWESQEQAMREAAEAMTATKETAAPETTELASADPETTARKTSEPTADKTESTEPDTTDPESADPESMESEIAAPETSAWETPAAETTVAETVPPATTVSYETASETTQATWSVAIGPDLSAVPRTDGLRIWVGDSRTEGLRLYVHPDPERDFFIAKVGEGYRWFAEEAVPYLEEILQLGNAKTVLIDMGVNDCAVSINWPQQWNPSQYAALINSLIDRYPGVRFCFYSVGPCSGDYEFLNPEVDRFNTVMLTECRAEYIDTANMLKLQGFGTPDGLHYDQETCMRIYYYVLGIQ